MVQAAFFHYRQTYTISCTLGNEIVDHSDAVGAPPVGAAPYIFIFDFTPSLNGLGKDNCKPRRETFKFWDVVRLY